MIFDEAVSAHEPGGRLDGEIAKATHSVFEASIEASEAMALSVAYPYPSATAAPQVVAGEGTLEITDGSRVIDATLQSDGSMLVVETQDGQETLRYAERAGDLRWADFDAEGRFVEATGDESIEWYLADAPDWVTLRNLPFEVAGIDGACETEPMGDDLRVRADGPRFSIRALPGNGRPVAVAPATLVARVGEELSLDGSSSCDPDSDVLTYFWRLDAAPGGSRWPLSQAASAEARFIPDVAGRYRLSLRVTDAAGAKSDPAYVVVDVE
jgi:hypothetical protein